MTNNNDRNIDWRCGKVVGLISNPVEQLKSHLSHISNASPFDSWLRNLNFFLLGVNIKPTVVDLVVELLNQPILAPEVNTFLSTPQWQEVTIQSCYLEDPLYEELSQDPEFYNEFPRHHHALYAERHCTSDEMYRLFSTIARRTDHLCLVGSPQIVACLLRIPHFDRFDFKSLAIGDGDILSSLDYTRLVELIQQSPQLQKLDLQLHFGEAPIDMLERLANLIQLHELTLGFSVSTTSVLRVPSILPSAVVQLLQHPSSRLRKLTLGGMKLGDDDFMAIAQALPASLLTHLNVDVNPIGSRGILEFCRQLSRILSLKAIYLPLARSSWDTNPSVDCQECRNALVQGMKENYSIEYMNGLGQLWVNQTDPDQNIPQGPLLKYYITLNAAGRRILASSSTIPLGLWPLILKRVMNVVVADKKTSALYFFLQNSPVISESIVVDSH